jgi:pyruvate dehydrogenase E2 component (dihydrolipoamide acetyltransferase)
MHLEFKLPDIGEGVAEGEVVAWHVREGERVEEDQIMVEVMTDKATVTIGAPKSGKIVELRAQVGSRLQVGDVLVVIHTGNGSVVHAQRPTHSAASAVGDIRESLPGASLFAGTADSPAAHSGKRTPEYFSAKPQATPATRKLARDLEVDLRSVRPTGAGGRVTQEDVRAARNGSHAPVAARMERRSAEAPAGRENKHVPFVGLRRRISERMLLAKNTAAHFTFVEECDASRLIELRERLKSKAAAQALELTYMPFIIKAVCQALKNHPMLNASLDAEGNELTLHGGCHIGIASATQQGLVVPVIHDADLRDLFELAHELKRLAEAARSGTVTAAELTGSTFTITSLGKHGGLLAVPILNLPNVGILGVHRIKSRPVVRDGQIAIGQVMLLSLSLDHRIVDGHVGAAFAYDVIARLEEPALLFMGA